MRRRSLPPTRRAGHRSPRAKAKAASATTRDGYPSHPDRSPRRPRHDLPQHLRVGTAAHTFTRLTTPTPLQARALALLNVKLHQ